MAPVQLPPPVLNNVINLPQQPCDPLHDEDIINAIRVLKSTRVAYGEGRVTAGDLINMEVFGHNVIQRKAGVPALLEDAMQRAITAVLDRRLGEITRTLDDLKGMKNDIRLIKDNDDFKDMKQDIKDTKQDIRDVKQDIRNLIADVGLVARIAALTHNCGAAEGVVHQLIEVPFPNGQWPTCLDNLLPLLNSRATVEALPNPVSSRYHQYYFPGVAVPHDIVVRKNAILTTIGCLPLVL